MLPVCLSCSSVFLKAGLVWCHAVRVYEGNFWRRLFSTFINNFSIEVECMCIKFVDSMTLNAGCKCFGWHRMHKCLWLWGISLGNAPE